MTAPPAPTAAPGSDTPPRLLSLSPSRAADFKTCPLLFRFRTVDHLPEPPSSAATRGTLVHAVLERLFDLPARERTVAAAQAMVDPAWRELLAREPGLADLFEPPTSETPIAVQLAADLGLPEVPTSGEAHLRAWLDSARDLLVTYFRLEDPTRLEPASREERVETVSANVRLRGIVDRIDVSPAGDVRIVDYKTGRSPREAYEGRALFQLKFYALVVWRMRGVVPAALQLMYLTDGDTLVYRPDAPELERFERTLLAIAGAVEQAVQTQDFRPHRGRACDWCSFQAQCPAFGGTPPPYPVGVEPTAAELDPAVPAGAAGPAGGADAAADTDRSIPRHAGNTNGAAVVSR